jgi:ABC-2 type transport system ATP-binding protein
MIDIRSLTKRFGPFTAVDGVTIGVERGEVLGFLGPNGAGKSTTMKMVTGFLPPTAGTAVVCGHDVTKDPLAVKDAVGYLPEGAPAYSDMTPESFLNFIASVRGLSGKEKRARIEEVVERVHLEGVMRQTIETLSKGFKRRVGLAQAILHDPDVLVMDEPTDGLDPNQKHEVRQLIREMAPRKAIVLSTHILEEVEAVCTRAVIINRGRIVFDGSATDLQGRSRYCNAVSLTVRTAGLTADSLTRELTSIASVATVEGMASRDGQHRCIVVAKNRQPIAQEVGRMAKARGWEVESMAVESGRLDDVFRDMTMAVGGGQ